MRPNGTERKREKEREGKGRGKGEADAREARTIPVPLCVFQRNGECSNPNRDSPRFVVLGSAYTAVTAGLAWTVLVLACLSLD